MSKRLFINQYEFHVFAMQRSGHHAICNWIGEHFDGKRVFINDISRLKKIQDSISFYNMNGVNKNQEISSKYCYKDALIINVEERFLRGGGRSFFKKTKYYPRGRSKNKYNVLVLRDPLNFYASRIKFCEINKGQSKYWLTSKSIEMWKEYAREFLNETNYLKNKKICINYVDWFSSREYRESISKQFGLSPSHKGLDRVLKYGKGSSFDLLKMNGRATDMKVLERWKEYRRHPLIIKLKKDEEVMDLYKKIFKNLEY